MIGIIIGIMLVVLIFSLSQGIQNVLVERLQMFGSDLILVFPGKETNPTAGLIGGQKFRAKDIEELEKIDGVKFIVPVDVATLTVEYKGEKKSVMIHGAPWSGMVQVMESSQGVKMEAGGWPTDDSSREVVLAYLTANSMFKNRIRAGDEIVIKSKRLIVRGILSRIGSQADDNSIFMSLENLRMVTGYSGVMSVMVKTLPEANVDLIYRQIRTQLSRQEAVRDFSVITPEKAGALVQDILRIVELGLLFIALVSLLVGAIGVMNTMYTSVLERVRQIGVMKAIGATDDDILSVFLIESGIIGLLGGLLGIFFGLLFSFLVGFVAGELGIAGLFSWKSVDFFGLLAILSFTFVIGILAGVFPARQAARLEPADALRYE